MWQDVRYAFRGLRRTPMFTAIAIGSAALGIGACTVMFTVLNAAMFKPLPVNDPGRLMRLSELDCTTGTYGNELSYLDFLDVRQARSFEGIAAYDSMLPASIGTGGQPERYWGTLASANYFDVVRPAFALGRGFDPRQDDTRGSPPVVVLSHDFWKRTFKSDPNVLGRSIAINKTAATIVGVTAAGFHGTEVGLVSDFWMPFSMMDQVEFRRGPVTQNRTRFWLAAVARLRPTAGRETAMAELDTIARTLNRAHGREQQRGFAIERAGQLDPRLRSVALAVVAVALGAAALVLVTACSNVASLLLGRAAFRRREIAARVALGASRSRLIRQLLTESLILSLLGGIAGWLVASYASSLAGLVRTPLGFPLDLSVTPDARVLGFCIALSIVSGVTFGVLPAIRATRLDLVTDLKRDPSAGRGRFTVRHVLVVAQVAICTVLLVCMGLFLRSLRHARSLDTGLHARNLVLVSFDPTLDRRSDQDSKQLLRDILDRTRATPGVEDATLTTAVPLTLIVDNSTFVAADAPGDGGARIRTDIYSIGPRFFATMGIPLVAGADFREAENRARVAIVNDAFARAAFSGQSPIGRRVLGDGKALDIIGVVATANSRSVGEPPRPTIYLPLLSEYSARDVPRGVTLAAKVEPMTGAFASLQASIHDVDPSLALFDVRTFERHVDEALILPRITWLVSAAAGATGLLLATIGVYGVVSFAVVRRRRELGIRLAVGATPREILFMILKQGGALALTGIVLGSAVALGISRFTASLLYGIGPFDPITFGIVPIVLLLVALMACLTPARAASRLDPVEVLRSE
jgi:predicted permease